MERTKSNKKHPHWHLELLKQFEIRRVYSSRTLSTFCELIFQFEHLERVRQPTKSKVRQ